MNYEVLYDLGFGEGYLQVTVWSKIDGTNEVTGIAYIDSDRDYIANPYQEINLDSEGKALD